MHSKRVKRQIKRAFEVEDPDQFLGEVAQLGTSTQIEPNLKPTLEKIVKFNDFCKAIEVSYKEYEDRQQLSARTLDISSRELFEVNSELQTLNDSTNAMLDSLGEGFFVVNPDGLCRNYYSRICVKIFSMPLENQHFFKLLKLSDEECELQNDWLKLAFANRLTEDALFDLGPQTFVSAEQHTYKFRYKKLFENKKLAGLVVVAADCTNEIRANQIAQAKIEEANIISKIVKDKEHFQSFVKTAKELLDWVKEAPKTKEGLAQVRFDLHTLKGGSASFYLTSLENLIHESELEIINAEQNKNLDSLSLSDISDRILSELHNIVSRFLNVLGDPDNWLDNVTISRKTLTEMWMNGLKQGVSLDYLNNLLESTLSIEIFNIVRSFDSTIQISSARLNKSIGPIKLLGENFKIPRDPYRHFFSSLAHLFRNSVDHGIEYPAEREQKGKPSAGQIIVRLGKNTTEKEWWLEVVDDGGGIDCGALRQKLSEKIDPEKLKTMSDKEICNLLLEKSVSSKVTVTLTSGMGVGLEAVGNTIKALGGRWEVNSSIGKGTAIKITLPLFTWADILKREKNIAA